MKIMVCYECAEQIISDLNTDKGEAYVSHIEVFLT